MQNSQHLLQRARSVFESSKPNVKLTQFEYSDKNIFHFNYEDIPSTMIPSEKWDRQLIGKSDVFIFQAKSQSQGRGQKSNTWISPQGNIYVTALCKIPQQLVSKLSMLVCSVMLETIQVELGNSQKVLIKWINDIYVGDKKVGGTLIKTEYFQNEFISQIGIGINLMVAPNEQSGCLKDFKKQQINIGDFSRRLIENLIKAIDNPKPYLEKYQNSLLYLNQNVKIYDFELKNILHYGKFKAINQHGHAILQSEGKDFVFSEGRMRL